HGEMEKFSVLPLPEQEQWRHLGRWQLRSLDAGEESKAALAVEENAENIFVERWGFADVGWETF
ncbi:MAG: hypothetical protein KAH96_03820, partial [Alphaproteobacteria bacterium]|nr:hypothetical protein [Alphaproteobacteria bacterium]